jgi:cyclopropane fatty-acyl-phospholipid synthase-like methyltransferase
MHDAALAFLTEQIQLHGLEDCERVLDLGGRDVNGTVHSQFNKVRVLDIREGEGVDIVADAATWEPDDAYQVVLCTEVLEHTGSWRSIIATAYEALEPGGILLCTCASRSRPPHSAIDGGPLRQGEWYQNVSPGELYRELKNWSECDVIAADGVFGDDDLYGWAIK